MTHRSSRPDGSTSTASAPCRDETATAHPRHRRFNLLRDRPRRLRDRPALVALCIGAPLLELAVLWAFKSGTDTALAPQVTALPPLGAWHDLRWLIVFHNSWIGLGSELCLLVAFRSAVDALLAVCAWPHRGEHPSWPVLLRRGVIFNVCAVVLLSIPARPPAGVGGRVPVLAGLRRRARGPGRRPVHPPRTGDRRMVEPLAPRPHGRMDPPELPGAVPRRRCHGGGARPGPTLGRGRHRPLQRLGLVRLGARPRHRGIGVPTGSARTTWAGGARRGGGAGGLRGLRAGVALREAGSARASLPRRPGPAGARGVRVRLAMGLEAGARPRLRPRPAAVLLPGRRRLGQAGAVPGEGHRGLDRDAGAPHGPPGPSPCTATPEGRSPSWPRARERWWPRPSCSPIPTRRWIGWRC